MEEVEVQREWLSYPDAERYSGLSRVTLWRAVGRGELKAARIGRAVRISRRELDAFMERAAIAAENADRCHLAN